MSFGGVRITKKILNEFQNLIFFKYSFVKYLRNFLDESKFLELFEIFEIMNLNAVSTSSFFKKVKESKIFIY
jgi:hypothetical protein